MDDLQDAIQDAQYIGAMVDVPRPSRPIDLPSDEEALEFADHLRATRSDALAIDTLLSEPLGFYLFSKFAESVDATVPLQFLQDAEAYAAIQTVEARRMKAVDMRARYLRITPPRDARAPASEQTGATDHADGAGGGPRASTPGRGGSKKKGKQKKRKKKGKKASRRRSRRRGGLESSDSDSGDVVRLPSRPTRPRQHAFPRLAMCVERRSRPFYAERCVETYNNFRCDESPLGVAGTIVDHVAMAIDRVAAAYHLPVPRDAAVARAPRRAAPSPAAAASTATAGQDAVGVKTADTGDSGRPHLVAVHDPHSSDGEAGGGQGPPAASDGTAGAVSVDAVAVCVDVSTHSGAGGSVGAGAGAGAGSGAGAGTGGGTDDVAHSELDAGLFVQLADAVLAMIHQRHAAAFTSSAQFMRLLKFKFLETRPAKESDFHMLRILGRGGFGAVKACKKADTGKLYAIKTMSKKRITEKKAVELVWNERKILARASSPFVVSLRYALQTPSRLHLVVDVMTGGDLGYHLSKVGRFTEERARFYAAEILLGLEHLHGMNIVYRDIKPDNILLNEDGHCRISDMGLATRWRPPLTGRCGTRGYWAPEMLIKINGQRVPYDFAVDWWSFGCLVYEFVYGKCPFRTEKAKALNPRDRQASIDQATVEMEPDYDSPVFSIPLISLLRGLLCKDPSKRLGKNGAAEIKAHKWFQGLDWGMLESGQVTAPFIPDANINAASQHAIGSFGEPKFTVLSSEDQQRFRGWSYVGKTALQEELVEYLQWQEREGLSPDRPVGCCSLL